MDQKILDTVTEIQKDFVYECYEAGDYKSYYCHRPNTNTYAFEITIGKMGIYLGGDIDSLVFRVSRDLSFLAGNDVDYYIHSKLEHIFLDQRDFCKEYFDDYLADILREALEEDYQPTEMTEEEEDNEIVYPKTLPELVAFYKKHNLDEFSLQPLKYNKAWDLYEQIHECDDPQEIYNAVHETKFYDGEMPNITKPSERIRFCLYMAHLAAKKILQEKAIKSEKS